jgi:hypothetical protein
MKAYFTSSDGGTVVVRARAEGDGIIGDLIADVGEGEDFFGVSYADLRSSGAGEIIVDEEGRGRLALPR